MTISGLSTASIYSTAYELSILIVYKIALRAPLALAVYHLMLGGHDSKRITGAVAYYGIFMHTIPEWFSMSKTHSFFFFWL